MPLLDLIDDVIAEQDQLLGRTPNTTAPVTTVHESNSAFSPSLPGLQLAWDSTSLGALKVCPRYYYYSIILGLQTSDAGVHLKFGQDFHSSIETYDRRRAEGIEHEDAVLLAVRHALIQTWDFNLNRPWTHFEPTKSREALVRAVIWYLDHYANDPLEIIILADGRPAVELPFRFDLDTETLTTQEQFTACGYLDKIVRFNGRPRIKDIKTTKGSIGQEYFSHYSPDNQMSLYDLAGTMIYRDEPIAGLIIDAIQLQVTGAKFQRGFITRTKTQREEWLSDTRVWLKQAEVFALNNHWPQNDRACVMYSAYNSDLDTWKGGCPFRILCGESPRFRPELISSMFTTRVWDPLQER